MRSLVTRRLRIEGRGSGRGLRSGRHIDCSSTQRHPVENASTDELVCCIRASWFIRSCLRQPFLWARLLCLSLPHSCSCPLLDNLLWTIVSFLPTIMALMVRTVVNRLRRPRLFNLVGKLQVCVNK